MTLHEARSKAKLAQLLVDAKTKNEGQDKTLRNGLTPEERLRREQELKQIEEPDNKVEGESDDRKVNQSGAQQTVPTT